jgi:photosystem II stability/assembly factor-like uncharacterized protein
MLLFEDVVYSQDYWQPIGPDGGGIYVVETHAGDSSLVFCSSTSEGFFLSTDRGLSWEARREGLYGFTCLCIGSHPMNPSIIYIGGHGLYKTTDMGLTWNEAHEGLERPRQSVYSIAADGRGDTLVYAGAFWGFYKSTNGGAHWEPTSLEEWTWEIVIDHADPSIVYAATQSGVYKSTDYGDTWELKTSGLDVWTFLSIVQAPGDSTRLYIAGASNEYPGRIYKTTDRCESWVDITDSLGIYTTRDLAVSSENADELYACVYTRGIYKTTDGGESWSRSSEGMEYFQLAKMSLMREEPEIVFTSDQYRGGVYRSSDGGLHWGESNSGIRLLGVADIEFIGEEKDVFLCATGVDGLKRYEIDEKRWEDIAIPCEDSGLRSWLSVYDISVAPRSDSLIYLATECGILKSTDAAVSWINVHSYSPDSDSSAIQVSMHPSNPDQIAALSIERSTLAFLLSVDGGNEWSRSDPGIYNYGKLISDPKSLSIYYIAPDGGGQIYKTTDSGTSWQPDTIITGNTWINSMILDEKNPSCLYAGVEGEHIGIYSSQDGGETWDLIWEVDSPRALALDPIDSSTLYCWSRTGRGVYKSTDGGYNWSDITFDVDEYTLDFWASWTKIHPLRREQIYTATGDAGILVLDQSLSIDDRPESSIPIGFSLSQNYPNPFNPSTLIEFDVAGSKTKRVKVRLNIYDMRGRLIRTLLDGLCEPGKNQVYWDGKDNANAEVESGIYFCRITVGEFKATRKLLLLK